MKLGHLTELTWEALFFINHTQNVAGKPFPDQPFSKDSKWAYLWKQVESFRQFIFPVYQVEGYQIILKLNCRPLALISYKIF